MVAVGKGGPRPGYGCLRVMKGVREGASAKNHVRPVNHAQHTGWQRLPGSKPILLQAVGCAHARRKHCCSSATAAAAQLLR